MKKIYLFFFILMFTLASIPLDVANAEEATAKSIEASVAEAVTESWTDV